MAELQSVNFSYSFDDLIPLTNSLAKAYKEESDDVKRQFILCDLVIYLEELTENYCKKFKLRTNAFEMDVSDAVAECLGVSLFSTLNMYDEQRGNFLSLFYKTMENDLISLFRRLTTRTAKFHDNNLSGDACYSAAGKGTLFDTIPSPEDFSDAICNKVILEELLIKFEEQDAYGKLIRIEMYGNATDRTRERLKALGVDKYGAAERQLVQRTKTRFKRFLIENNFTPDDF